MQKLTILILILLGISMVGCDSGLEIMGMEIAQYPDRIVYYIMNPEKATQI